MKQLITLMVLCCFITAINPAPVKPAQQATGQSESGSATSIEHAQEKAGSDRGAHFFHIYGWFVLLPVVPLTLHGMYGIGREPAEQGRFIDTWLYNAAATVSGNIVGFGAAKYTEWLLRGKYDSGTLSDFSFVVYMVSFVSITLGGTGYAYHKSALDSEGLGDNRPNAMFVVLGGVAGTMVGLGLASIPELLRGRGKREPIEMAYFGLILFAGILAGLYAGYEVSKSVIEENGSASSGTSERVSQFRIPHKF